MKDRFEEYHVFCNWCGKGTTPIWVHGHGQCARCRTNIDEFSRGEQERDDTEVK